MMPTEIGGGIAILVLDERLLQSSAKLPAAQGVIETKSAPSVRGRGATPAQATLAHMMPACAISRPTRRAPPIRGQSAAKPSVMHPRDEGSTHDRWAKPNKLARACRQDCRRPIARTALAKLTQPRYCAFSFFAALSLAMCLAAQPGISFCSLRSSASASTRCSR